MDAHDLVVRVKDLASELGRAPTIKEFFASGVSRYQLEKHFRNYTILITAAGLPAYHKHSYRDDRALITPQEPLRDQLEAHVPREFKTAGQSKRILVIGDTHWPFVHKGCMEAIYEFNHKERPDHIVQVGDLLDLYSMSKFPRSMNFITPQEEERLAVEGAKGMWEQLKKDNPNAKCFQLLGNHDIRPAKRVLELAPGFEHVVKKHYQELMQFEGVTTIDDYRQELVIDNIVFHHGYRTKLGDHRDYVRQNFVCGHTHRGGAVFRKMKEETIWELNAGYVGDHDSKALSYSSQKMTDHTLGWGFIDEHGPRFIPY